MVAAVLTLLWRDVPGVTELTRLLEKEGFLWCERTKVSQQAMSQRFLTFPAILWLLLTFGDVCLKGSSPKRGQLGCAKHGATEKLGWGGSSEHFAEMVTSAKLRNSSLFKVETYY